MLAGVEDQVVLVGPDPLAEGQAVPEGQLDVAVTLAHASPPLGRPLRRSPGTRASCVPCPQTPGTSADNSRARPRPPGVTWCFTGSSDLTGRSQSRKLPARRGAVLPTPQQAWASARRAGPAGR